MFPKWRIVADTPLLADVPNVNGHVHDVLELSPNFLQGVVQLPEDAVDLSIEISP